MKHPFSYLSLVILLLLLIIAVYTIIRYPILAKGEGWGVVFMIGIAGIIATGFIADIIVTNLFRKKPGLQKVLRILAAIAYITFFIVAMTGG